MVRQAHLDTLLIQNSSALPAKLPQMMIVMFINKITQLLFGHFSKKGMHKNRGRETGVFFYHGYPFAFLGGYVAGSFMHNQLGA